jgi:hypothetical protein
MELHSIPAASAEAAKEGVIKKKVRIQTTETTIVSLYIPRCSNYNER